MSGTVHQLRDHPSNVDTEVFDAIAADIYEQKRRREVALTWFMYAMCTLIVLIVAAVCYGLWRVASDLAG